MNATTNVKMNAMMREREMTEPDNFDDNEHTNAMSLVNTMVRKGEGERRDERQDKLHDERRDEHREEHRDDVEMNVNMNVVKQNEYIEG